MSKIIVTLVFCTLVYGTCSGSKVVKRCGPREEYKTCGSSCPATCRSPNAAAISCIALCKAACFCKEPYVRNESTNKCVKPCDCPRQ